MARFFKRQTHRKIGLPPGTLTYLGEKKAEPARIRLIAYQREGVDEKTFDSIDTALASTGGSAVSWLNIDGLHQVDILQRMGTHFNIHPLVLEDILNTSHRPKMEDYQDYLFVVVHMLRYNDQTKNIESEQLSLVLGSHFVLSFQERPGDLFDPIRQRIRSSESRLRRNGPDYLLYRLLDAVIDQYFTILEKIGERVENLEAGLMENPSQEALQEIHHLKREMMLLRKSIWPLREIIGGLEREETPLIQDSTEVFLRDLYDHTIQVMDTLESFRDMVSGMLDIYMSSLSNKMNEVMKVLTMIATIFIPITFIAGIFGMNFSPEASPWNMPELSWYWGYPATLLAMGILTIAMLLYFRRKHWL